MKFPVFLSTARSLLLILLAASPFLLSNASLADYVWKLPPGFPIPRVPADNPMSAVKVELGCRLFFEPKLSATGTYSCASCHKPELAFTDGRAHAIGATGELVRRNTMSLANVAYNPAFTWANDRVLTLEAQMLQPLFAEHPLEMGLTNSDARANQLTETTPAYATAFRAAFPEDTAPVTMTNVIKAIASFERTLIAGRSAFDRYVFDDDRTALSASARRGMSLFFSTRVNCSICHSGINFAGPVIYQRSRETHAVFVNTGLYNVDGSGSYPATDTGLAEISHDAGDMGKFRIPTLRNIELTAPYMHDGSLATLEEVLDHYMRGGRQQPRGPEAGNRLKSADIRPLDLNAAEQADLIEFLRSLTDHEFTDGRYACRPHDK